MTEYAVLAHMPKDPDGPIHRGAFPLAHAEWTIERNEADARARAEKWRKHFATVLVRPVGEVLP